MSSSKFKIIVVVLFILSGICGLIYEVVWSKYLALFIGSSGYSHMIVLATYMGGLALGAFVFGKYADKYFNQLKLYGLLEIGIGLYCLLYPFLFQLAGNSFVNIASLQASTHSGLLFLKFLLSFVTLILPTFLMGGTLPILTKFVTKNISNSGKDVAVLYYINSFGAVIGTALGGFYLVRHFGMETTIQFTAIFNIIIGLIALAFSRFVKKIVEKKPAKIEGEKTEQFSISVIRWVTFTALVSGLVAMLYELAWIRLLSNILGSTTYSFSIMLIAFISGIAIGSFIVSLVIKKIKNLLGFLAFCQLGTAVSIVLMLPLYERLPYFLLKLSAQIPNTPDNFSTFLFFEFLFCFLIMLIPTIFSGMSLPVATRIANSDMKLLGKSIGGIFSINTIGSVIGALLTGLILIPQLGVKLTLELGLLINGMLGVFLLFKAGVNNRLKISVSVSAFLLFIGYMFLFPGWNHNFLISGVFRTLYTQELPSYEQFKAQQNEGNKILWFKEGVDANVAVRESVFGDTIQRSLVINGKADASTVADLPTQVLLGQLPLMLQPNTGDVLVIGLGSGITCGSALRHPIRSLDVVEISEEVVECNSFFANDNYNFTKDKRTKIYIDDAITKLKVSPKKYDHIISEPSNPWIAGIGNLYSQEFFELCKSRMTKNGILTQWFHTYDVNNDIFKLVMNTISQVFPHVSIWKASNADIIILASAQPLSVDFDVMAGKIKNPSISKDLARIKMYDIPTLLSTQIVSPRNNPYKYENSNKLNSTNNSPLEYLAPVALFTHAFVTVLDSLDERFTFQDENLWFSDYHKIHALQHANYMNIARYRSQSNVGDYAIAYSALCKALEMEPSNNEAQNLLMQTSQNMQLPDLESVKAQLNELRIQAELNPSDNAAIFGYLNALVEYYRIMNSIVNPQHMNDAVDLLKRSIQLLPSNKAQFQYILGMVLTGAGRSSEAAEAFIELLNLQRSVGTDSIISDNELLYFIGESYYNAGNIIEAEKYFKYIQSIDPKNNKTSILMKKIVLKEKRIR